jgi:hypothetical protein
VEQIRKPRKGEIISDIKVVDTGEKGFGIGKKDGLMKTAADDVVLETKKLKALAPFKGFLCLELAPSAISDYFYTNQNGKNRDFFVGNKQVTSLNYDAEQKIIYVGKAKNLKKRVQSYFTKNHENYKTAVLVKKIVIFK